MLKKIFLVIKKIIMSAFLLYGYNLIASPLGCIIPINIFTVAIITFLGFPSLFSLIIILLIVY